MRSRAVQAIIDFGHNAESFLVPASDVDPERAEDAALLRLGVLEETDELPAQLQCPECGLYHDYFVRADGCLVLHGRNCHATSVLTRGKCRHYRFNPFRVKAWFLEQHDHLDEYQQKWIIRKFGWVISGMPPPVETTPDSPLTKADLEQQLRPQREILNRIEAILNSFFGLFAKFFNLRKRPPEVELRRVLEPRYQALASYRTSSPDKLVQIKWVVDYTYDVHPIARAVSLKHRRFGLGENGVDLMQACKEVALLHKDEWAAMKKPFKDVAHLYNACYNLMNRKRHENPFKMAD